ncbi:hypothetical protein [Azospira restricta]|uniref:Uncharacterized protein n=1 Tax=Azospira restricta TaxID=404405 RepID=A0A974SSN1_9RHOO|nr:hypothetical protein [Azospira restricta]QRJ65813.1 hypothetical protein IWH25_05150 [Azospira restricta]
MDEAMKRFQDDLLESVRQMKAGKAARVTTVDVSAAAEARNGVGENAAADSDAEPGGSEGGGVEKLKAAGVARSK